MKKRSREKLLFNIQEARVHLQELEAELAKLDDLEPISLRIQLGHVQEHLCLAWNTGVDDRFDKAAANQIPNWTSNFELIVGKY